MFYIQMIAERDLVSLSYNKRANIIKYSNKIYKYSENKPFSIIKILGVEYTTFLLDNIMNSFNFSFTLLIYRPKIKEITHGKLAKIDYNHFLYLNTLIKFKVRKRITRKYFEFFIKYMTKAQIFGLLDKFRFEKGKAIRSYISMPLNLMNYNLYNLFNCSRLDEFKPFSILSIL
uniref:Uncharacterized protein n=1 Tax=Amorphochlora amoebiformis TaxID=1561963 RepID=A0A0H5BR32_9EUKA|nr:hypothetical protein [Amorphochlora amoebiformis]